MSQVNEQILLVSRPQGEASVDNFKLVQTPLPSADELSEGQVLVRHHYLSLDPYMRGRMNDSKSYAEPQPLNSVMLGGTVGEVLISKHPKFGVGDKVVGMGGWQTHSVVDATQRGALVAPGRQPQRREHQGQERGGPGQQGPADDRQGQQARDGR